MVRRQSRSILIYGLLFLVGAIMAFPFFWMISSSLKPAGEITAFPPSLLPVHPTLVNYSKAIDALQIGLLYANTGLITVSYTLITVFISCIAGYMFAKFDFRWKGIIFIIILATLVVPKEVYVIPLYLLMSSFKLINTYISVILPFAFSAYGVFLARQFAYGLPDDLISAARVDGCGETFIFLRIVLPLMKPVLAALSIFYFLYQWNDFLWPLVMLNSERKFTLAIGLANFVGDHFSDYGMSLAGATFSVVPMLIVFVVLQRYIMSGIALTGMKG